MPNPTSSKRRTPPKWAVIGLMATTPLAVLLYGGVHPVPRWILAGITVAVGLALTLRSRFERRLSLVWALAIGLAFTALSLVPVPADVRSMLHGDLAAPVISTLALTGQDWRPLALDPAGALLGVVEASALLLLAMGVAGWGTRAGRVRTLSWSLVATGVACVVLMLAHKALGLASIYNTGVGAGTPEGFFAPYVNPNHGGLMCSAVVPLAWARMMDGHARARMMGAVSVGLLAFGVWASGSRAAVVALCLGLAAVCAAAGGKKTRRVVSVALATAVSGVLLVGPEVALRALSAVVDPTVNEMVAAGYTDLATGRLGLFSDAWAVWLSAPILGVGAGSFDVAYAMVRSGPGFNTTTHAHNEFLQMLAEHGVVVSAALLFALVVVVRTGLGALETWSQRPDRRWHLASFLGVLTVFFVGALVDFPMRLGSHSTLVAISLGALVGLARPQRGGRPIAGGLRIGAKALAALAFVGLGVSVHGGASMWGSAEQSRASAQGWIEADGDRSARLTAAEAHLKRAVVRGLVRADFQRLAAIQAAQGRLAEGAQTLAAGVAVYPTMPWLWRDAARLAAIRGDDQASRTAWARMLALDLPRSTDPMDVLHEAMFGGPFDTPIERARAILPERADRHRQAARVMDQLGLVEESETLFRRALSMEPSGVHFYAQALLSWGRPGDALMLLQAERQGCSGERMYSQALLQLDRVEEAVGAFTQALRLCGASDWTLRAGLAKARLLSGDTRGEDAVKRLLEERPDAHGLRRAWLWVLSRRGRPVEGTRHLEHLKYAGVIRSDEAAALDRARRGLPFKLDRPTPPTGQAR